MTLPADMSQADREKMRRLLETVQQVIHDNSSFVQDFN